MYEVLIYNTKDGTPYFRRQFIDELEAIGWTDHVLDPADGSVSWSGDLSILESTPEGLYAWSEVDSTGAHLYVVSEDRPRASARTHTFMIASAPNLISIESVERTVEIKYDQIRNTWTIDDSEFENRQLVADNVNRVNEIAIGVLVSDVTAVILQEIARIRLSGSVREMRLRTLRR